MAATASDVIWHVAQADVVILFQSSANAGVVFAVGMKQTGNAMAAKHVLASSVEGLAWSSVSVQGPV